MSATAVLTARTNGFATRAVRLAYSSALDRLVAVGAGGHSVATSDDHGTTWVNRTNGITVGDDVVWSPNRAEFVAIGDTGKVSHSSDGITWSAPVTVGANFFPAAIAWSPAQAKYVMVGCGYSSASFLPDNSVWTSPDAITWTARGAPFVCGAGVAWSPTLSLWAATDTDGFIWSSPTGIVWTSRGNHFPAGHGMRWLSTAAKFAAVGGVYGSVVTSTNGTAWTQTASQPFSGYGGIANDIVEIGTVWIVGGHDVYNDFRAAATDDAGASWTPCVTPDDGTASQIRGLAAIGSTIIAAANTPSTIMSGPLILTPQPAPVRFYQGYDWRWIVTTLEGRTLTFLDPLAMNRQIVYQLNDMAIATCDLPSDNPEVNIISGDLDPFVSNANRLLYAFRREQPGTATPWVCRFAGVIEELNDEINANIDAPVTHLTAYDPWHYLDSMPVVDNIYAGRLPGQGGVTYPKNGNWTAASVVVDLVKHAESFNYAESTINPMPLGPTYCYIDYQSGHVPPNVADPTPALTASVNFQQGMTVGDALRQMTTDGLCDITFTPIYPMVTNPLDPSVGALCKLNVYQLVGSAKNDAVMAWDMPGNSLVGLNRLESASTMGNHAMLSSGTAGSLAIASPDAQSTQKYGPYWYVDSVNGKVAYPEIVRILAQAQVLQRAYGQPTFALDPAPERSPIPLLDYGLGDSLPIYTSSRFREQIAPALDITATKWEGLGRVWSIPISMPDDAPETVTQMVVQVFPVPPHSIFAPIEAHITTALAAARRPVARGYLTQQRAMRRLQTFYGHLSGYGYGT